MPDSVKVIIVERNGVELQFREELAFTPANLPFSDASYVADNVNDAILESSTKSGQARLALTFGANGTMTDGDYFDTFAGVSSSAAPFVIAENCELIAIAVSRSNAAGSGTLYTVRKNAAAAATISLTTGTTAFSVLGSPIGLVAGDKLDARKTSGQNSSDTILTLYIKVTF